MLKTIRYTLVTAIAALGFWACQVAESGKIEDTASFTKLYDTLSQFDHSVIVFKGMDGTILDTVYQGKVDTLSEIEKLPVKNWDGGKVKIEIAGIKDGREVYKVEKVFDGTTNKSDTTFVIIAPGATLTSTAVELRMIEGDSIPKPDIAVNPASLRNKAVSWTSSHPDILGVGATHLNGLKAGTTQVTIVLDSDPSKTLVLQAVVSSKSVPLAKITLSPKTLTVAVGGAPARINVQPSPSTASAAVSWRLEDSTKASVNSEGWVQGLEKGSSILWAVSKENSALIDSTTITVTDPVSVERVRFSRNPLDMFVGGPAESLVVEVLPPEANPDVDFSLVAPGVVSLADGKITALATGQALVIAKSRETPSRTDTLKVMVLKTNTVDSVVISPRNPATLTVGGADVVLAGNAFPSEALKLFRWISSNSAVASVDDGRVSPVSPGTARIYLVSQIDSLKKDSVEVTVEARPAVIDTVAPKPPVISGASPTGNPPQWKWTSGGGGSGDYRHKLGGDGNLATGATTTRDTSYTLATAVSGTTYTLHVQERDSAGNWSPTSSLPIKYDLTKPTVTISSPQASGIHYTTAATVALTGSTGGPNAIAKVAYSVDGGEPVNATLGAVGTWSVAAIALATEKAYAIVVTATDALGNSGEAALSVVKDITPPSEPSSLSSPTTPTNVNKASLTWAAGTDGVGGSGLNGQYRYNINGGIWTTTSTASAPNISLVEGKNTFNVQEQDKAGNWSASASKEVVLDTRVPDAVTFTGTDGSYTTSQTPTWKWAPSTTNGGVGVYVLKLNTGAEFELSATTFIPTTALADNQTHTLTVREKDQVAGAVGAAKSFSYKVKVNPPGAPTVKSAAAGVVNNGSTNNPKFTWVSGGRGKGVYRVRLNAKTTYETHPQTGGTQTDWTLPANSADGTYTINVSEQDDAGTWGEEGSFTIKLDRTGPVLTDITVTGGGFALREGFITNKASIGISFKADGVAKDTTCALAVDNNTNACKITAKDELGNLSTLTRNVWRRSNVLFVKQNGIGNGSSWEEASGDLPGIVESRSNSGKEIWAATGAYSSLYGSEDMTLYGGFNSAQFPTSISGRNLTGTTIAGHRMDFGGVQRFDGIVIKGMLWVRIGVFTCQDCRFEPTEKNDYALYVIDGGTFTGNNIQITGQKFNISAISVNGRSKATINGGSVVNNTSDTYPPISIDGDVRFTGELNVYGNEGLESGSYQATVWSGSLIVDSSVSMECGSIRKEGGTVTCGGREQ